MATLARRSGVPAATIKHYLREGLLPGPVRRTARNMAWYDAGLVERIALIKRLQREHFLPLGVIRRVLAEGGAPGHALAAAAIARVLARVESSEARRRGELLAAGTDEQELALLEAMGLVRARGEGDDAVFTGDDLALLRTLGAARKAGITRDMLPASILRNYVDALRALVRAELALYRDGVLPRAGDRVEEITEAATTLSEGLVVLLRRKLLLPTLSELSAPKKSTRRPRRGARR